MQNIRIPPTEDVVKETLKRSQAVAKESRDKYTIVIYNLAVAKIARQIQIQNPPKFDDFFIQWREMVLPIFVRRKDHRWWFHLQISKGKIIQSLSPRESFASNCNAWFVSRKTY